MDRVLQQKSGIIRLTCTSIEGSSSVNLSGVVLLAIRGVEAPPVFLATTLTPKGHGQLGVKGQDSREVHVHPTEPPQRLGMCMNGSAQARGDSSNYGRSSPILMVHG
jgi:hypothetical protein